MDMLRAMGTFVCVARLGSFAKAAQQMGVSRSIVSKHVKDLEDHIGGRLFHRTTRRLSLTEIGVRHLTFCTRILEEIESEYQQVTRLQMEPRGEVRLMAPKSFGNTRLASVIADFAVDHLGIKVSMLLSDDSFNSLNLVGNGVDVAIRLSEVRESSIVVRRIGSLRWLLCASPSYLMARGTPVNPPDLRQHKCLVHLKFLPDGAWRLKGRNIDATVKVTGNFIANSSLAIRAAALRGLGIALLPAYCVEEDLRTGELREVLEDFRIPQQPVFVLYPHQRSVPTKVRLLVDYLSDHFSEKRTATAESRFTAAV